MHIVNLSQMEELVWNSPKGKFGGAGKQVSEALGRRRESTDLMERHPFDVEILRIPPGKIACPFHSHSAQWEFYQVLSGKGVVRHEGGSTPIAAGDAFLFKPGEAHCLSNPNEQDVTILVVADNPIGESCHYPDSNNWLVRSPAGQLIRSHPLDYFDGEE